MLPQLLTPALATLTVLAMAGVSRSQDLARDLPWRRVAPTPTAEACVEQGVTRLLGGWDWEAARLFRELVQHDDKRPLGHLLLALALRAEPNRAARLCWQAVERLPFATGEEPAVIGSYQRYFDVTQQPELVDARFAAPPAAARAEQLIADLQALAAANSHGLAARLLDLEQARRGGRTFSADTGPTLRSHRAYLEQTGAMPFLIPGYRDLLALHLRDEPDRDHQLARLPNHPKLGSRPAAPVDALPGLRGGDELLWQPKLAPGFDLPRGLGGRGRFDDYQGKPLLVLFFLGFG